VNHGSLFTGIGGFDLGFEWAGIETVWQVEINPYCQKVLELRFPHAKRYSDIRKVGKHNLERVDIISGGFPCQDISIAGKGAGIDGSRSGLWSEMHRIIGELRPRVAVIENVPMLIHRGLRRVLTDLAKIRYDAEWQIVGADDIGAPHRRKRIWIVAYPDFKWELQQKTGQPDKRRWAGNGNVKVAYPNNKRLQGHRQPRERAGESLVRSSNREFTNTHNAETSRQRGNSGEIYSEPATKRLDLRNWQRNWMEVASEFCRVDARVSHRVDRLKGLGNAVVPHIPYLIGKKLKELYQKNHGAVAEWHGRLHACKPFTARP